jgi:spermidine synthase
MTVTSPPSNHSQKFLRVILVCFFISGLAGLLYEILWVRMLGLVFGHTVHAVTTVLVAFMTGLAVGSYLSGRVVDRISDLFKLYALLEVGIGLYCLIIPLLIEGVRFVYLTLEKSLALSFTGVTLVQFVLVLAVLLFPTTLMGATLPLLSRLFAREPESVGALSGRLYSVNTFGAVLGAYLAGFELLPVMGIQKTLFFAVTLNIGIGIFVFVSRQWTENSPDVTDEFRHDPALNPFSISNSRSWNLRAWLLVTGFAFSGVASMVYEISWTRALSLVIGSSTYAFSTMLLTFLVGIAAGSAVFVRIMRRYSVSSDWFVGLQLAIGISAAAVYPFFDQFPKLFLAGFQIAQSYFFVILIQTVISFAVMFLPTFFIGATFPCVVQVLSRGRERAGADIGRTYAFNTAGAILGSFAAGFILIPAIGIQGSIKIAIAINLTTGLVLLLIDRRRPFLRAAATLGMGIAILAVVYLPTWNDKVMSSGVAVYASDYVRSYKSNSLDKAFESDDLLYYKDGISSTVSVHRRDDTVFLRVNGKTDASNKSDMHTQLMLGHIPALLHPNPKNALVIGLGSGITVGALSEYRLNQIDVVEIEPSVVEASSFFKKENRDAISDPRVRLNIADGRNYLLMTPQKYDLIVSEPSNPWIGGVSTLFTVEFFKLVRQHLNPGGIMTQWFHGYSMKPEDVQMVVASFRTAFPHATLWITGKADYLLVGTVDPLVVDLNSIVHRYEDNLALRQDMERMKFSSPVSIMSDFYLDEKELAQFAARAELNTDDRLALEFSAPRSLYENTVNINQATLRRFRQAVYPPMTGGDGMDILAQTQTQYMMAADYISRGMYGMALEHLKAALAKNPHHIPSLLERGKIQMQYNQFSKAMSDFTTVLQLDPKSIEGNHQLGMLYLRGNKPERAIPYLERAVLYDSDQSLYHLALATAYRNNNQFKDAVTQYQMALTLKPQDQRIMGAMGATLISLGLGSDAAVVLGKATEIDPADHRLYYQLGRAYLLLQDSEEARRAFGRAIVLEPGDADAYVGMGNAWLEVGDEVRAKRYFSRATTIKPNIAIPEI